jgi:hypothetical protein
MNKWVLAGMVCALAATAGAETTLVEQVKAYGDGKHNAFTDLVRWHDAYYLCFRHGAGHLSMDGEIRVMRSADLKTWEPCGTLDTLADDRDPHFAVTDKTLYVFFGVWDLVHATDNGVPGRGRLRSHFASTEDGNTWSKVQGVYEPDYWLWRVRAHAGTFYSVGYYLKWPSFTAGEARLLKSEDALNWTLVSVITKDRLPDEADIRFHPDDSLELIMRNCDKAGDSMWLKSDPGQTQWRRKDLGVVIHCPVICEWKDRCFVAGRGRDDKGANTSLWEMKGDTVEHLITLPSGGDTAYPGLIIPDDAKDSGHPVFAVSWYSQHERAENAPDEASIYVGRIEVKP